MQCIHEKKEYVAVKETNNVVHANNMEIRKEDKRIGLEKITNINSKDNRVAYGQVIFVSSD